MEALRVLRTELYRAVRSRGVWVSTLMLAAVPALWAWFSHGLQRARELRGGAGAAETTGEGWGVFVDAWRVGLVLGTLLLLIHSSRSLAADRESWVLRLAATRRASRAALVLGRAALAPVLVAGVVLVTGAAAWWSSGQLFEFGPVGESGYVIFTEAEVREELWTAALATVGPLLATYALGLLVSAVSASAVVAVSLGLGLFLVYDLFKDVLQDARYWIFATYVPSLQDTSAMKEMAGIARGFSDAGFTEEVLRMNQWLPWPEALVLVALALLVTWRRPL